VTARRRKQRTIPSHNQKQAETFSDADLQAELGELTRAANRANHDSTRTTRVVSWLGADIDDK
jgi:NTP pyrophosphatase (non-canonical NTP hydrolase)